MGSNNKGAPRGKRESSCYDIIHDNDKGRQPIVNILNQGKKKKNQKSNYIDSNSRNNNNNGKGEGGLLS